VTTTTPDAPAAPPFPDWDTISHDVTCPLCGYNLRGLTEARCPECGSRFHWPDVIDPHKGLHPYLFEHHPERNCRSFAQTLVGTLRPARFWASLSPTQPLRPRRMRIYWLLTALIAILALVGEATRSIVETWLDARYATAGRFTPFSLAAWTLENWRQEPLIYLTFNLLIFWLAWPWLMLLSLQVFRASMRRAKVRTDHVLRCVVYSFDVGVWFALLSLAATAFAIVKAFFTMSSWPASDGEAAVRGIGFVGISMLVVTWRMTQAYKRYMGFDHALATIVAAQVITMLLVLNWIGFWANFG